MDKQSFLVLLQENHTRVSNFFSYEVETSIRLAITVHYTFAKQSFDAIEFSKVITHRQAPTKLTMLEYLTSRRCEAAIQYKLATYLALHNHYEEELKRLEMNERLLVTAGFRRSPYVDLSSLFLTDAAHAKRAVYLYQEMRKHHVFLTGKDDIPYAVLLTKNPCTIQLQAKTMRMYYDALVKKGLKQGGRLQTMAQLLTLYDEQFQPLLVEYVMMLESTFTAYATNIKKQYYPYIALLALTATDTVKIEHIILLTKELQALEVFHSAPDDAFTTAVHFIMYELIEAQLVHATNAPLLLEALSVSDFLMDLMLFRGFDILDFLS